MTPQTIGELATTLEAFGVRCQIDLEGGVWTVRVGPAMASGEDFGAVMDEAIRGMARAVSKAVA